MNEKEIGEIRRRFKPGRHNIGKIYGCYVGDNKEIVSKFSESLGLMPENEAEKYLDFLKKTLSGSLGRNLLDISFRTSQVVDSPEHKLLTALKTPGDLSDEILEEFYQKIINTLVLEGSYAILLGRETYDVPFKAKDGETFSDGSTDSFSYVVCAVCPVKDSKTALRYIPEEATFHDKSAGRQMSAPELGFLFPAFDSRATNLYGALYYTRSPKESHQEFVEAVFNTPIPKPAAQQKQEFETLLTHAVEGGDSFAAVQAVHGHLRDVIAMHKESRDPEPLTITHQDVRKVLADCGVEEAKLAKFSVDCDSAFGTDAPLSPKNLIDPKHFSVKTPDVVIQVNPDRADLIETRVIGGTRYIMICADESVEVNGVEIGTTDVTLHS